MKKIIFTLIILTLIIPFVAFAHPGRTDSSGCHTCKTNCISWGLDTGEYHCHRSKGITQPVEPVKSIRNEGGTGKTVPAPEYKIPAKNSTETTNSGSSVKTTTPVVSPYVEKPSLIKRLFNWLF